jgi:hypothetical protein
VVRKLLKSFDAGFKSSAELSHAVKVNLAVNMISKFFN